MWWAYVLIVAILVAGIVAFVAMARARTRQLSSRTTRTAESMYDEFADPPRVQRRLARRRGGSWHDTS
ncbi:MAG: hypothetical protein ACR2LF_07610 [Jatrophihabitantaceae bacterium]